MRSSLAKETRVADGLFGHGHVDADTAAFIDMS
jgi:hypothetical protein